MKICVAQTRPVKGDVSVNIDKHKKLIDLAIANSADIIVFPELSITGYEPALANDLATTQDDSRFDEFQEISDANQLILGVGMPIQRESGILIGMIIFQPHTPRQLYAKQHLHPDEYPYFVNGQQPVNLTANSHTISLAICYELFVAEHAENAAKQGADIYIASVAKSVNGVDKANERLADIASTYSMTVLMANCIGYCDNFDCGGKTAIWNNKGSLISQLDNKTEGILLIDTATQVLTQREL